MLAALVSDKTAMAACGSAQAIAIFETCLKVLRDCLQEVHDDLTLLSRYSSPCFCAPPDLVVLRCLLGVEGGGDRGVWVRMCGRVPQIQCMFLHASKVPACVWC